MIDLLASSPLQDHLPLEIGAARLSELPPTALTSIQPFRGGREATEAQLQNDLGVGLPRAGTWVAVEGGGLAWFGRDTFLLQGPMPPEALGAHAALSDQSDAWARLRLEGEGARAVLSRLVPVDLRPAAFSSDAVCRTLLGHISVGLLAAGENGFDILVFRSMGQSAVEDLQQAMSHVAARSGNHPG